MRACARLLDGKLLAAQRRAELAQRIQARLATGYAAPVLATVCVAPGAAERVYLRAQQRACERAGIVSREHVLAADATEEALRALVCRLSADANVHGVLVQLPLPAHIDAKRVVECISAAKDVDGLRSCDAVHKPPTVRAVLALLKHAHANLRGLDAVVVGAGTVGRPLALELLASGCTVTVCHKETKNLQAHVERAELLVVAVGAPRVVPGRWVRPGATVIDIGINRQPDGAIVGDVEFTPARERAAWITPVPGGVGPVTVVALLENTLDAAVTLQAPPGLSRALRSSETSSR